MTSPFTQYLAGVAEGPYDSHMRVKLSARDSVSFDRDYRAGSLGGTQARSGGPQSGKQLTAPVQPASRPKPVNTKLPASNPKTPQPLSSIAPRSKIAALPDVFNMPNPTTLGALMGILFGRILDTSPGHEAAGGAARDAAIGAAAFASAEQELSERLRAVQNPGMPTVMGPLPVIPTPIRRPGSLTL